MSQTGRKVQGAVRVQMVQMLRRRYELVVQRENGQEELHTAGRAEQVAGRRLGRGDHELLRVDTERFLKRLGFDPATASAPFVATLVDVTGLVIYFTIAYQILKGTLL